MGLPLPRLAWKLQGSKELGVFEGAMGVTEVFPLQNSYNRPGPMNRGGHVQCCSNVRPSSTREALALCKIFKSHHKDIDEMVFFSDHKQEFPKHNAWMMANLDKFAQII